MNTVRDKHKIGSKLYYENNQEINVTLVQEIQTKFVWWKDLFLLLFCENNEGGSLNWKNKLILPYLPWTRKYYFVFNQEDRFHMFIISSVWDNICKNHLVSRMN